LQTTVSDVIEKRVEQLGLVYNEVSSYDLEEGGNLQIPTYNAFAKTVNTAEGSSLTNLGTTVEGGIGKITLDPQRHGGFIPVFNSFIHKLNGKHLTDLLDILAEAFARGRDDAILNANGSGINILGMNQNATTIPFTGDALTTFKIAAQNVADAQRGGLSNLVAFMSTTAWLEYMELFRDLSNNRAGIIDPVRREIYGVKCVVTDVIESTGNTPNKSSTVTVGYGKTYKYGQTKLQMETDKFSNMLTGQTNLHIVTYNDGQPSFNNAFAKFSLANIF
jgi:HK97 family phage major capsid protein